MTLHPHCQDCGRPLTVREEDDQTDTCDVCLLGYDPEERDEELDRRYEGLAR